MLVICIGKGYICFFFFEKFPRDHKIHDKKRFN